MGLGRSAQAGAAGKLGCFSQLASAISPSASAGEMSCRSLPVNACFCLSMQISRWSMARESPGDRARTRGLKHAFDLRMHTR